MRLSAPSRTQPGPTGARRSTVAVASPPVAGARPPASLPNVTAIECLVRRVGSRTGSERDNLELRIAVGSETSALFLRLRKYVWRCTRFQCLAFHNFLTDITD